MTQQRTLAALRAARAALGWTQLELAGQSGVALVSIARIEAEMSSPRMKTVHALIEAMQRAGVTILDNQPGGGFTLVVDAEAVSHKATNQEE